MSKRKQNPAARSGPIASNPQSPKSGQVSVTKTTELYQGPIPHPDILRGFDAILPGTAKELIELGKSETLHRRSMDRDLLDANIKTQAKQVEISEYQTKWNTRLDLLGQISSTLIVVGCVIGAVYLAKDSPWVAGALVSMPIASIIKAMWRNK